MTKFKETIYDWRFWILGGFIIIGIGVASYIYWDSIASSWRRGGDDPGEPFVPLPMPENSPTPSNMPSVDSDSSGGSINKFFRKTIFEKVGQYKEKVKGYFLPKATSAIIEPNFPRGVYTLNGKDMYLGLPLPRTETLPNGFEYYVSLRGDGSLRYLSNNYSDEGRIYIINPFTGNASHSIPSTINERVALINQARSSCISEAPVGSYSLNTVFDGVELMSKQTPSSSSATDLFNKGKSAEVIEDINLTPKAGPSILPSLSYDLDLTPKTRYSQLPEYNLDDPFN